MDPDPRDPALGTRRSGTTGAVPLALVPYFFTVAFGVVLLAGFRAAAFSAAFTTAFVTGAVDLRAAAFAGFEPFAVSSANIAWNRGRLQPNPASVNA